MTATDKKCISFFLPIAAIYIAFVILIIFL